MKRAALAFVLVACARREPPPAVVIDAGAEEDAQRDAGAAGLPPLLPDGGWFQTFADDAGVPTYVAVPTGATTPRPIVVGLHGAQDRPDWACAEWFGAVGGRAFVTCPRGSPLAGAWAWSSVEQLASQAARAIALVRERFGPWVADGRALYGGWSQAATLGALVLAKRPDLFDGAVLVELGHTPLDPRGVASAVRESDVSAIAVVCATPSCERWCATATPALTGLRFQCTTAGHRGHTYDGVVAQRVFDAVRFVEKDDPRWTPLLTP